MPARLRTFWAANPFQGQYSEEEVGPCGCGDVKMCFLHLHYFWNRLNLFVSDSDSLHWVCRALGELSIALTKQVIPSTAELSVENSIQHVAFCFWHFLLAPRITQHIPLVLMNPQTIALDARSQKRLLHLHVSRFTFEVAKQCQFGCCLELSSRKLLCSVHPLFFRMEVLKHCMLPFKSSLIPETLEVVILALRRLIFANFFLSTKVAAEPPRPCAPCMESRTSIFQPFLFANVQNTRDMFGGYGYRELLSPFADFK